MEVDMKRHSPVLVFFGLALLCAVTIVQAREQDPSYPATAPQSEAQQSAQQMLSSEQLDNLVAPIALYPDPLLGQLLVASTYPLELVEANQWLQRNRQLRGQALTDAAKQQPWDPSVQALVAVPDALAKLNQDIRWTTDLGNAFLSQQADLMNAVQRMRARAKDNGRLSSTPQQTVATQEQGEQQVIVIQPANPQVIYVPTYDPYYVWGPPLYGYYPPLFYPYAGFGFGIGFDMGFCFGGWGGWGFWGWGPSWFGHTIVVNHDFFYHHGFHPGFGGGFHGQADWMHDPAHRMRVPYASPQVASRFGGGPAAPHNSYRGGTRAGAPPSANPSAARVGGQAVGQGSLNTPPQAQRSQSQSPSRYQVPQQQNRSATQQYREGPRVVPFGNQSQRSYQVPQQSRSTPQVYRTPQMPQQSRSTPQSYRAPQALQQSRSAPQFSAPRSSSGGSSGRAVGGGFSGGGAGSRRR
jgi:hypothetical protein